MNRTCFYAFQPFPDRRGLSELPVAAVVFGKYSQKIGCRWPVLYAGVDADFRKTAVNERPCFPDDTVYVIYGPFSFKYIKSGEDLYTSDQRESG